MSAQQNAAWYSIQLAGVCSPILWGSSNVAERNTKVIVLGPLGLIVRLPSARHLLFASESIGTKAKVGDARGDAKHERDKFGRRSKNKFTSLAN